MDKKKNKIRIKAGGYLCKKIDAAFVWFDCKEDGIAIYGQDSVTPNHPFLVANRTRGTLTRIPGQVASCYGMDKGAELDWSPLGNGDVFLHAKQAEKPGYIKKSKLVESYTETDGLAQDAGDKTGTATGPVLEFRKLEKLDGTVRVTLNRRGGVWVSLKAVKAPKGLSSLHDLQSMYGQQLQCYPYDRVTFWTDSGKVQLPEWFLQGVFGEKAKVKFSVCRRKTAQYILLPEQDCELTGEKISFTEEIPETIELCGECMESRDDIAEAAKVFASMKEKLYRMARDVEAYKESITELAEASGRLEKALSEKDGRKVESLMEDLKKWAGA